MRKYSIEEKTSILLNFLTRGCSKKNFIKEHPEYKSSTLRRWIRGVSNSGNSVYSVIDLITNTQTPLNLFKLPIKNIAVCATMSSGKSTLVNALLGNDVLPARNEATTAKITSIYDRDGLNTIAGFCMNNNKLVDSSKKVTKTEIDSWNNNESVNHIYLQGDIDNISNEGKIVAVHDTPGTNNSGDKRHHDLTIEFLSKNKIDALIYVANCEQLSTTDEKTLLTEIKDICFKDKDIPFIFVLNKIDSLDLSKENFTKIYAEYENYLKNLGFNSPRIFPVSAKAARLFKMALKGKSENFTAKERADFYNEFNAFTEDYDFSMGNAVSYKSNLDRIIKIGRSEYTKKDLLNALNRTGLRTLEEYVENFFNV